MPGFDGTGPQGRGPMTGGGRGYCATGMGGVVQRGFGKRGWPHGGSYGRGARWSNMGAPTDAPPAGSANVEELVEQIRALATRVQDLTARLDAQEGRNR